MVNLSKFVDQPNTIVSIDASTNNLAYAIFIGKKLDSYGKINFNGADIFAKVADSSKQTYGKFNEIDIEAMVIEHAVFMNSPKTMADLAMVQGGIISSAIIGGINKIKTVAPITWQNYIGNKALTKMEKLEIMKEYPDKSTSWYKAYERNLRKQKTINFVNINYDLEIGDHDVADAIAIGHYAIHNWERLTK